MGDWYLGHDDRWHWQKDAPAPDPTVTSMLPAVTPYPREPARTVRYHGYEDHQLEQDDLSHLDESAGELVSTEKLGALDEVLIQPPQDPDWRP